MELHASGDSDLGEASPPRNWRIYNKLPGRSAPVSNGRQSRREPAGDSHRPGSQRDVPVRSSPGPKGLMMGTESGGDPSDGSHLTGPQPVIRIRSSPDPRGSMRGSGGGGVPPVDTHRPGPQGANTAGHRAEISPRPPPPNMPQTIAPGIWSSRLFQAAIAEATRSQSVSAPTTTAPPARQPMAEPVETAKKKKKKAKKRRAANPLPELPPAGKKLKKRKGKKQFGSTTQGDDPPNEAQLFAMMKLMAAKHGWAVEDQAPQFEPGALASRLSPHRPPTSTPYPGLPGPRYGSHQSGTSGAGRPIRGRDFHPADGAAASPRQHRYTIITLDCKVRAVPVHLARDGHAHFGKSLDGKSMQMS